MATYIPNASDTAQPTEDKTVESAALEFRTLKSYTTRALVAPETGSYTIPALASRAGKVLGFDAAGEPVVVSVSGATDPNLRTDLAASSGSSLVGFTRAETGAVSSSVQTKIRRLVINPEDFGAAGNGILDDTTALQNTFNAGIGHIIDGGNNTYKCYSQLTIPGSDIVIQNMTLDFSSSSGSFDCIYSSGTAAGAVTLTSNTLKGSNAITVGSTTGFAANDYVFLSSQAFFASISGTRLGQIAKIKTVNSATSITLYEDVLYNFNTADSANISKLTTNSNITFKNVKIKGRVSGSTINGIYLRYCSNVTVESCAFENFNGSAITVAQCINTAITGTKIKNVQGTGYGIQVSLGAYNTNILGCSGEDVGHGVFSSGGSTGVNLYTTVSDCNFAAVRVAGIQSSPGSDFATITNNSIQVLELASASGIVFAGLNSIIANNSIVGNSQYGIFVGISPSQGTASCVISGNNIKNHGTFIYTDDAIYVQTSQVGNSINGLVISNNIIEGSIDRGIHVTATSGDMSNVTIANNIFSSAASTFACSLQASSGRLIENYTITGNVFQSSGGQNLYLYSGNLPNKVNRGTISGNRLVGGTTSIALVRVQDIVETGNFISGSTNTISVDADCRNIYTDRRQSAISTTTAATYTVSVEDEYVIANRAGTVTLTLPTPNIWPGRELTVKTIQAQTVVSGAANVVPIDSDVVGSAILPAVDGAWALLKSNGTNWVIMQKG